MSGWAELPVASVPAFASRWLLVQMRRGPLTGAEVRAAAALWRSQGRPDLAAQLEVGWAQLKLAARAWDAAEEPGPAFAAETAGAKVAEPVAPSGGQDVIATKEAAEMLGVTQQWVGNLIREGTLAGRKVGSAWMVERASVDVALAARRAS